MSRRFDSVAGRILSQAATLGSMLRQQLRSSDHMSSTIVCPGSVIAIVPPQTHWQESVWRKRGLVRDGHDGRTGRPRGLRVRHARHRREHATCGGRRRSRGRKQWRHTWPERCDIGDREVVLNVRRRLATGSSASVGSTINCDGFGLIVHVILIYATSGPCSVATATPSEPVQAHVEPTRRSGTAVYSIWASAPRRFASAT